VAKRKDRQERSLTPTSAANAECQAIAFRNWYIPCSVAEMSGCVPDEISTLEEIA